MGASLPWGSTIIRFMSNTVREHIHRIWDRLADFPEPLLGTDGLRYLLESISELIDADHGYWLSCFLLGHLDADKDPMLGWRPGPMFFYKEMPDDKSVVKNNMEKFEAGEYPVDESTRNHVRQAGCFRATLMRDHVSAEFFNGPHYRHYYQRCNITDTLFVAAPVNTDTEVYFCFNRVGSEQPFGKAELDVDAETLRSLGWFHKKVLLGHGLLIARQPLTPTEKKVMHHLLTGLAEKQIAEKLDQKADTTHKHVGSIYRKFNVRSRAALTALWLGQRN